MSNSRGKDPRPVRMRASCDVCFMAKVKCSKDKPICRRCVVNGTECAYSPSSRAGKHKADSTRSAPTRSHLSMYPLGNSMTYSQQRQMDLGLDVHTKMDSFWDGQFTAGNSLYGQSQLGGMDVAPNSMPDSPTTAWTPDHDQFTMPFGQFSGSADGQYLTHSHSRSSSFDPMMAMNVGNLSQAARDVQQMFDLHQTPLPTPPNSAISTGPFPPMDQDFATSVESSMTSSTVESQPIMAHQSFSASRGLDGARGTCTCFRTCILSLDSLHSACSKPDASSGDTIMKLNDKAMEGCSYMLSCPRCTGPMATDAASVLAHIIDKISWLYKFVLEKNDDAARGFRYSQPQSTDFLAQVISQRLSTLQVLRQSFLEQCMSLQDHPQVCSALINIVNNSMIWVDEKPAIPFNAIGAEAIKYENDVDSGFRP